LRPYQQSGCRGKLAPQFFSEPVASGEVHIQHFLEMLEQLGWMGSVVTFALQPRHMFALIGHLMLSLREVSLGGR
jgi:hypothetical protein